MNKIRLALAQINPTVGDLAGNTAKITDFISIAQSKSADVVVFPELALTGYPPEDLLLKRHFIEGNLECITEIAGHTKKITAVVGFVDCDKTGRLYNAAAIVHQGKLIHVVHKQALPNYGVFDEKRYFFEGGDPVVFELHGLRFGVSICEDIWVNSGVFLQQSAAGAELLINISSSPYEAGKPAIRRKLLSGRANQTKAYIAYANVVGGQDELVFDGGSYIFSPDGKNIAFGRQFEEDMIYADIDGKALRKGKPRLPVIELISHASKKTVLKPTTAKPLDSTEEMYKALVLGTRDYIKKNGFKKVVIGLSGGIDSALVAVIACDAIGRDNVIGVTMPSRFSSKATRTDAKRLADNLGIKFLTVPIWPIFLVYMRSLARWFVGLKPDLAEENLQARIRGTLLMAFSNKFGWLVLTTGNKSEMAVGYCTLYGDMSGGFAVIKDILKTKVYELCRFRNGVSTKPVIPKSTLLRAPTAELRANQKDQDSLPSYELLDQILQAYVEEHRSISEIIEAGHDPQTVKKVIRLVDLSEYKRRQAPPGVKISSRAFGKDWRLPITNRYKEIER